MAVLRETRGGTLVKPLCQPSEFLKILWDTPPLSNSELQLQLLTPDPSPLSTSNSKLQLQLLTPDPSPLSNSNSELQLQLLTPDS